jgi:hypothetical protein
MATLTLDTQERRSLVEEREGAATTLDSLVARSWSTLRVTRAASCLLCGGEVMPRYGSGPGPVGGTCRSCGTEIS